MSGNFVTDGVVVAAIESAIRHLEMAIVDSSSSQMTTELNHALQSAKKARDLAKIELRVSAIGMVDDPWNL